MRFYPVLVELLPNFIDSCTYLNSELHDHQKTWITIQYIAVVNWYVYLYLLLTATLSGRIGMGNHPEWPHRQGGCLAWWRLQGRFRWGCTDLCYARGSKWVLLKTLGGASSQLDLPSLTPLSVAGHCRLQLGVPNWATSLLQVVYNWPHILW